MPPFAWRYDDDEIAQLATFVRSAWGNDAAAVSAADVKRVRTQMGIEAKR
jgi:mono/diheme cytochrome c family protein